MPAKSRHAVARRLSVVGQRLVATFAIASLLAAGFVATDLLTASAAGTPVTGTVFRDFNSNGQKDTAGGIGVAVDIGLAGVTVTAYDRTGATVGTTTTAASGDYSLAVAGETSSSLRVEFTGLPAGYQSSFHGTGSTGTQGASSVQFVQTGATNVNFSVNAPEDYSQSNPPIITAIQRAGLASTASLANQAAIVAYPWTAGYSAADGQGTTFPNATTLAKTPQVGSIWGTAFQGKTNSLYAAATYKRHSGLGPGGIAEIYRITGVLNASGAITTGTPTVSQWLNLQGKPIVGGGTVDLGTAATDAARGIGAPTAPATDLDAYQKAGKIGIGAMAISADQNTLYFINLNDRNLYSIDISDPVAAATSPVIKRYTLGLTGGQRPWAVELNRGYIYVGYVDSGESFATPASAATAAMSAHIIRAAETTPTVWSADLLNLSLGYTRGSPGGGGANPVVTTYMKRWNTWTDLWSWTGGSVATTWFGGSAIHVFPQPILSNIQFDNQGYVSLAFLDRGSLQGGNRNHSTVAGDNTTYESLSNGDLLMASQAANGVMTTESNAAVGTRTGTGSATQAPGGKEFYFDQQGLGAGATHQEVTLGGLTGMGGVSEVVATVYDPLEQIRVAGTNWFSTTNGGVLRGYNLTPDAGGSANADGTFQKGGGLGDIEALSDDAPLEIGNRVWFDADQDGIQDADEPAIAGVTVNLIRAGVTIGTRITNAAGEYYFRSTDADLGGKFLPDGGAYTVQFVKPTTGTVNLGSDVRFGTVNWSDASFTGTTVGSNATIDSNATPNVGNAALGEYVYTAGHAGQNDATIDAGIVANGTLRVVKAIDPSGGASDVGATYPMTVSAVDFRGTAVSLGANASFSIGVGTAAARDISLPVGTLATVNEAADARVRTFSVSPSGATLISGTGAARTVITVTNTLYAPGTFTVAKTVTGSGSSLVASNASFTVEYNYAALGSTWKTLVVQRDGAAVASDPIPYGTIVTLREVAPTVPSNVTWGTPKWTVGSVTTTAGTQTLTIGDGTIVAVGLENPNTVITGGFTITKVVSGPAAPSVPTAFTFPVTYSYVDLAGVTQSTTVNLTKSGATQTATVTNVPVGTVVTVSEGARGNAAPDVAWGTPIWSGSGVATQANGTATFTVGSTGVSVVLDNPTTRVVTSLTLTKSVTGPAASYVPGALSYTVNYNYTDFAGLHTFTTTVSKDSPTVTLDNIPLGVTVNLAEVAPSGAPASVAWSTAKWTSTGATVTDNGNGSASIVVSTASAIILGLENPTTLVVGGFTVTKSVTG
ncbi:MAG: DUF5979 domain-containing protein, partial [Pseudolysinimonas sp.]